MSDSVWKVRIRERPKGTKSDTAAVIVELVTGTLTL
jgi:hypothetical protein